MVVGQTLSHYRVIEKLGSGGMGDVYLAQDSRLGRNVALKVLPTELTQDAERRLWFTREAKALAALNHPNIVTVHSVEEADGTYFFTMEVVAGKTLAHLLPKDGFSIAQFFELAVQIVDAIAAAHQVGITHRDLKPANVMVRDDGRVKILDFGLAKVTPLTDQSPGVDLPTRTATRVGLVVGTVAYMSPEQAEGKSVDARSDVFSIGVLLYEMLSGKRPFAGDTPTATLASIIRDTPTPLRAHNPEVPRDVERIVNRCLAKDLSRRTQTALDVRNQLEEVRVDLASGGLDPVGAVVAARGQKGWFAGAALVVALAVVGVLAYVWRSPLDTLPRLDNPVQLTTAAGAEDSPAWSPDGTRVAFESNQSGNWDIWVAQVGGGPAVNLTADHRGQDRYPSWSPDGNQIAYLSARDGGGVFLMGALGGPARKIFSPPTGRAVSKSTTSGVAAPQWAPTGDEIAVPFELFNNEIAVVKYSFASQQTTIVTLTGECFDMSWSPDGRYVACVAGNRNWEMNQWWVAPATGGEPIFQSKFDARYASFSWSADSRFLFFTSDRGGSMDLWRQRMSDGRPAREPERMTAGLGVAKAVLSPRGDRVAYSRGGLVGNVWRVPILRDRLATWADAEPVTSERAVIAHVAISPDKTQLAVASDRSGSPDLWLIPLPGGAWKRLTADPGAERGPRFSSDGTQLAFQSSRSGNHEIEVMPTEGGPVRTLASHPATDWFPAWSPDDREIAFISDRGGGQSGAYDIWIVSSAGGEPRRLTDHPAKDEYPVYSPDGAWVLFRSNRLGDWQVFRAASKGGEAEPLTKGPGGVATWAVDGKTIYFIGAGARAHNFWALSIDKGREVPVTDLSARPGELRDATLATDGKYLYFVLNENQTDLWVMDIVKQ